MPPSPIPFTPLTAALPHDDAPPPADAPSPSLALVVIDDNPDDAELIELALVEAGLAARLTLVEDERGLVRALEEGADLVLCDYKLPRYSPERALALMAERWPTVPLIVVTRAIGEQAAVEVLRQGARDYVAKNHLATLPSVIQRVLKEQAAEAEVARTHARLAAANQRLRELGERLLEAQERERRRIARELHDVLGQSLTSVLLHLEAAERVPGEDSALQYRDTARTVLRDVLDQVRTLSFTLQPPQIGELGLPAALDSSVELLLRPLGIMARIRVRGELRDIPVPQASVLYRVVLEAVANIVRHAHASRVRIGLAGDGAGHYSATVLDDGDGFDLEAVRAAGPARRPLGLNSMTERCELVGGRLRLRSRPGRGTLVHARV
ncbi:histidine kinase [Piscinibacter sakaiensis]|uniref:histidine kinase n=1 Tax=Piscinibacter sakaiensis TaxID=1547922 RepID=A0A0K8NY04_PISS1|nr:histidine kinase [Piscinibacter sakaiensis]GAP35159.1 sensor histidine kinase [Piscinibacter sakaiensis]